ncbi:MAG: DUF4199 domain-containing protein [Cyclobacteriaceae bacterium]|nr:DUF4199 domain-containing protein [Cyclobacteriaceae bacterium]
MRKTVLIFGLIAGLIVTSLMLVSMLLMDNGTIGFENGELFGYATMIIALSMIYFGVRSFRDNHNHGVLSFGKGFQVGILIAAIAAVIYASGWEVYVSTSSGDFMEQYTTQYLAQMEKDGASITEREQMKVEMDSMANMYKNPVIRFGMTLMEIVPVGLIITLLSAFLLKRNENIN